MAVLTLRQAVKHINGGLEALPDKRRPIPALPFGRSWTFTSESLDVWMLHYGRAS